MKQSASRILVIHGKRRIGKSTLAKKIAEGYKFFNFSGLFPSNTENDPKNQIDYFFDNYTNKQKILMSLVQIGMMLSMSLQKKYLQKKKQ